MTRLANLTMIRQDYARSAFEKFVRSPNDFDVLVDEIKFGVLKIDSEQTTIQVPVGRHAVYLKTPEGYYGTAGNIPTGNYNFSQTVQVELFEGEYKKLYCGHIKKPAPQHLLMGALIIASIILYFIPASSLPVGISEREKSILVMICCLLVLALAWYGHSSTAGSEIFLREDYNTPAR